MDRLAVDIDPGIVHPDPGRHRRLRLHRRKLGKHATEQVQVVEKVAQIDRDPLVRVHILGQRDNRAERALDQRAPLERLTQVERLVRRGHGRIAPRPLQHDGLRLRPRLGGPRWEAHRAPNLIEKAHGRPRRARDADRTAALGGVLI